MFAQLKRLAGHSAVYTAGEALRSSLGFLLLPLYTRALTPGDYGILGAVGPVYALLSIVMGLGLQAALVRFYFEQEADRERLRAYVGTLSTALLGSGVLIGLGLMAVGPWLFGWLLPGTPFDPYLVLTIWNACISLTLLVPLALFRVQQRPANYVLLTVGDFVVTTGLIVLFVVGLRQGALGNLRAQVLAAAVMAVPALWITVRNGRPGFRWSILAPSLAFSLPLLPHMLGNWVLNVSDRVVLDGVVSKAELGLYTLGYQFGLVLNTVGLALNNAWVPFFYKAARERRDDPAIPVFVTYLVLPMVALALAFALLARELIQLMADPAFWAAYRVVPWVVLGYLLRYLYYFPVNGLFFTRKTRWVPLATLVAGALNIGLNLLLAPIYGIMAAAVNTAIGFGLLFGITFAVGQRHYRIPYEYGRLARVLGLALLLFAVSLLLPPLPLWPRLAVKLGLLAMYPPLLVATGFLTAPERRRLAGGWRRARARFRPPPAGEP